MRVYCLEEPLSATELEQAGELLGSPLEQVRIPYVLPVSEPNDGHAPRPLIDVEGATPPLKSAGILRDYGRRVGLVIPGDMHWYAAFAYAIHDLTGYYPFLVQTAGHRQAVGNPGSLRIIDMHGLMTGS